ncbi:hypothetical protein [uncultured Brevundimonas sp.]|jgi:hypothetical protein|uniref:hypothetical protein n=1 Tax=uncultured Brevundimonas sp. TaxID=213418 RepID=UPI0030EE5E8F
MSVAHPMRHWAHPLLLAAVVALALASCQAKPVEGQSQTVDGLRLVYGVIASEKVGDHPRSHPESRMHDGPPPGTDHVTLAVFDATTNQRINDAQVSLSIEGPRNAGPGAGRLDPMHLDGSTTYGGYVSLQHPGRYLLIFHVARPGRRDDPVRAAFAYKRS